MCKLQAVKLALRIVNLVPLFMALLIVETVWKLAWQHLAANSSSSTVQALAGAAAYQS